MTAVLVTDGEQRAALAVVRSLGWAGYDVAVVSHAPSPIAFASRHTSRAITVPDPAGDAAAFGAAVRDAARSVSAELVIPVAEASLLALLAVRDQLAPAVLPVPPEPTVRRVLDKAALLATAARAGIAVPAQWIVHSPADIAAATSQAPAGPLVAKTSRSLNADGGHLLKFPTMYAANAAELAELLRPLPASAFPVLVQQRIVGPGTGIFLLRWNGADLATFAHRRVREKPPSGGVSVCSESIAADPALVAASRRLLAELDWQGVAMVEYKIDERSGTPYLMEINGRFWGSLQLAIDAGVDFPALLAAAALGRPAEPVHAFAVGRRNRWFWGDMDHLLLRLRRSPGRLGLAPGAPSRLRVLRDVLLPAAGQRGEVFRVADPMPFVRETLNWIRRR